MAIELTCPHCSKQLRVKDELAGKKGKCPACGHAVRVPRPPPPHDEADVFDLAPLDEAEERRRQQELARLRAAEEAILTDKTPAPPEQSARAGDAPPLSVAELSASLQEESIPAEEVRDQVYRYVRLMSEGQLDRCATIVEQLAGSRSAAEGVIDQITMAELSPKPVANIPRPVLLGFLRQLREDLNE